MANRRTIGAVIFDASTLAPTEGSPLRRKSMAVVSSPDARHAPDTATEVAANNDEREKLDRRRRSRAPESPSGSENSVRRQSIGPNGLSGNALAEHYQKCIRLCAEGKITSKNVFSLSVIDYIGVLNKNDKTTNNMQTAQATLDISTKIYGLRVDCVYMDVLKMAGNPVKQSKNQAENQDTPDPDASVSEDAAKKKRQRKAQKILVSNESLTAPAETLNYRSTTKNSESQTSDMLLQVMYPVLVRSGQSLYLYEDVSLEFPEDAPEKDSVFPEFEIEPLEEFSKRDICRPLLEDWRILGWSETDVPYSPPRSSSPMNDLRFDLDASIHPDDNVDFAFDGEDESQVNVDRCVRRQDQIEHIVDFERTIMDGQKEKNRDYSYVPKPDTNMHWAGPDHWKPGGLAKLSGRSTQVGACGQRKGRRKKVFAEIEFSEVLEDDIAFTLRKKIKNLRDKTVKQDWPEANTILPDDVHIEDDHYINFYYETLMKSRVFARPGEEEDRDATVIEDVGYDYDNDNDQEYCSQSQNLEPDNQENVDPEPATQAFTGDNLVTAPKATQQIQIQYATRAKKVNMKQLKEGMWKCLSFPEDREDVGDRKFSQTYKKLEIVLGKEKSKALSIGLAFASLLHLANEKNLDIKSSHDMTDLKISQNRD